MNRFGMALGILALGAAATLTVAMAQDDDKPKHTIKEVMKTCMKGGLCKKVASGEASDAEKKELVAMFESLAKNKPPKGEADSWKEKTTALLKAAKACAEGDEEARAALMKAANCMGCHQAHKGG